MLLLQNGNFKHRVSKCLNNRTTTSWPLKNDISISQNLVWPRNMENTNTTHAHFPPFLRMP